MSLAELQAAFGAHLRDPAKHAAPADIEDRRMQIYRDLFYNNVESFIAGGFPVLRKLFSDDKWHRMVRDFFASHQSKTPYFPRLTEEFVSYIREERQAEADDPAWLTELVHYEWVEAAIHISAEEDDYAGIDRNGDLLMNKPVMAAAAWLLEYQWPVHKIGPDFRPDTAPDTATYLVVYRNRQDDVAFMEINPVTARLLQLIESAESTLTGQELIAQLASEMGQADIAALTPHAVQALNQLREREILLGSRT